MLNFEEIRGKIDEIDEKIIIILSCKKKGDEGRNLKGFQNKEIKIKEIKIKEIKIKNYIEKIIKEIKNKEIKNINFIEIGNLLLKRFNLVKNIGKYKNKNNIKIKQNLRFKKLLKNLKEKGKKHDLKEENVEGIWNVIHFYSLRYQNQL